MKVFLFLAALFLMGCGSNVPEGAEDGVHYGLVKIDEAAPETVDAVIAKLQAQKDLQPFTIDGVDVMGMKVQVKGAVVESCRSAGCWFTMLSKDKQELFVNMKEHKGIPTDAKGKALVMEGVAYFEQPALEEYKAAKKEEGMSKEELAAITAAPLNFMFLADGVKMIK